MRRIFALDTQKNHFNFVMSECSSFKLPEFQLYAPAF